MSENKKETPMFYGGQAVMEGVMMRGREHYCVSVRNPQGEIESKMDVIKPAKWVETLGKIPIIRGIVRLGSSMIVGMKVMKASAEMAGLDDGVDQKEVSKFDKWLERKFGDKLSNVLIIFAMVISLAFSVALFMVLPTFLAGLLPLEGYIWARGIVEGLVRFAIFLGYIFLISRLKDIQRVFEYHGAEHKVINCYEAGVELTPENVKPFTRLHKRCGTSFLLFVMLISMIFFLFVRTDDMWLRLASRVLFVPFIAGISFEVIRWAGISDSFIVKILSWPGFMMQKLTTKEPDEKQIAVAIMALEKVIEAENQGKVQNEAVAVEALGQE